jgi:hypothetical protein
MAGLINLRLLTDFFNKIGPSRHFAALRNLAAIGAISDSRQPNALKIYGVHGLSLPDEDAS